MFFSFGVPLYIIFIAEDCSTLRRINGVKKGTLVRFDETVYFALKKLIGSLKRNI